ncbi:related to 7alpha-cephem-methoxylase P8 chain [Ramularia collo-cygni]|uniref:Related to 7alpha-cephem-methoxylase P8 chain n=1 Tax=Ramularia collo-cygni TaxID=112498 RepID=A0A2D3UU66_9PEZI|nr:related to 7alpha-cephem-methoxylase P8 chain [Ramularia collo-cygni]CZT21142.1 related to 7alpha-cephem-methoxylase P8 chain [Ramularia collo-cygni]
MTTTTSTQSQTQKAFGVSNDVEIPRGETKSSLVFYKDPEDGSRPFNYVEQPPEGMPQRNYGEDNQEVVIHDIRGHEHEYDMNVNGFGVVQGIESEEKDFTDDEKIKANYYPEVEKVLLDNARGAKRVFIFDHTVRRSDPNAKRAPVNRAHIDQTTKSAIQRVNYHMGGEAEELLKGRYRLINVWRPLNGPVVASPLAYADSRSVPDDDIVPVEHRYPHRTGETAGVKYTPNGKWHYWSGMKNDERILLQCYDSKDKARTPHSAFVDRRTQPHFPGRESIEVRALVFG